MNIYVATSVSRGLEKNEVLAIGLIDENGNTFYGENSFNDDTDINKKLSRILVQYKRKYLPDDCGNEFKNTIRDGKIKHTECVGCFSYLKKNIHKWFRSIPKDQYDKGIKFIINHPQDLEILSNILLYNHLENKVNSFIDINTVLEMHGVNMNGNNNFKEDYLYPYIDDYKDDDDTEEVVGNKYYPRDYKAYYMKLESGSTVRITADEYEHQIYRKYHFNTLYYAQIVKDCYNEFIGMKLSEIVEEKEKVDKSIDEDDIVIIN